jgi:hypothetical protein
LINKDAYKSENLKNKLLNELSVIIVEDSVLNNNEKKNKIIEINKLKLNDKNNYINQLTDVVQLVNKQFYYCYSNKTLYSLENGGPGVKDLIKIHDFFTKDSKIKYESDIVYNNIFTIKRSGDYLQIDYCKKNNYMFISTDQMSASFCFIEDCEFIGPFGNCGLFIKKYENNEKYCYNKDIEFKTTDLNCSIEKEDKIEDKMEEDKKGKKRKQNETEDKIEKEDNRNIKQKN